MTARILLRRGIVIDGEAPPHGPLDVLVEGDRIVQMGERIDSDEGATVIDCTGRLIAPGFIDAHSHAEAAMFDDDVQLALLRQGVTTIVGGQDGVSFAPGSGEYATEYFAAINGPHPTYRGSRVRDLLASYDGATRLNAAYLVPAGTVRHEVCGTRTGPATVTERAAMVALVEEGLSDGAVGLSSGLDYAPGIFADADEIGALCTPLASRGLPYVTHMRGGYETNARAGVLEVAEIARVSGARVHISHFHLAADDGWDLMEWLDDEGIPATFDMYPYTRGCTLLAMPTLPPEVIALGGTEVAALLDDPQARAGLHRDWLPRLQQNSSLGPEWATLMTIGHVSAAADVDAPGHTVAELALRRGQDPYDVVLDLLRASRLQVNVVMAVPDQRPTSDLGRLFSHPRHVAGSDGIFIGAHPHPRARGTFTTYLETYTREEGFYDWQQAARHLSTAPADLFHLSDRGRVRPGQLADLIVIDPETVAPRATYDHPTELSVGIDDVLVAGSVVLRRGSLTDALPGRGLTAA